MVPPRACGLWGVRMRRGISSDWTRVLIGIITCSALGMAMGRVEAARARPVVPVETAKVRARWSGHVPVRRVMDEATGTPCIEYAESSPQRPGEFWTEIERVDLDRYDVLRFRWKMAGDPATATVSIEGYPAPDGRRNYYLFKRPNPPGQWQDVWLDLRQDDDGVVLERHRCPQARSGSASRWRFPIWGSFPSALRYAFAWPISASCAIP